MMPLKLSPKAVTAVLKVGVFALLAMVGTIVFAWVVAPAGYLASSALSVFLGAAVANALAIRIFDRGWLADVGFAWNSSGARNLLIGTAAGLGSAALILGGALLVGAAELYPVPGGSSGLAALAFLSVILLFGAAGEEMLFHGYAFQVLVGALGPFAAILPVSLLFALAHASNLNVSPLGLINTGLWGVILGYAFIRSGDLWLPIGLHFGWNWTLPLFGTNLSGFTMNVTGHAMRWKIPAIWSGGEYGPEGGLLTTAVLAVLFAFLLKAPVRRQVPFLLRDSWED